jgi:hypothetical protein
MSKIEIWWDTFHFLVDSAHIKDNDDIAITSHVRNLVDDLDRKLDQALDMLPSVERDFLLQAWSEEEKVSHE